MTNGNRDQLWNASWETYYDAYFYEIALSKVVDRWKLFDVITKIIVAITATGSAVAGWSLWSQGTSKEVWAFIAGTAAVLSIIHAVVQAQSILETNADLRASFSANRVSLESFRQQLAIFPDFAVKKMIIDYKSHRNIYEGLVSKFSGDILLSKKLRLASQEELNIKLGVSND
jgi:uncharacterized membrane protein